LSGTPVRRGASTTVPDIQDDSSSGGRVCREPAKTSPGYG
jgi:hypothetical protein